MSRPFYIVYCWKQILIFRNLEKYIEDEIFLYTRDCSEKTRN